MSCIVYFLVFFAFLAVLAVGLLIYLTQTAVRVLRDHGTAGLKSFRKFVKVLPYPALRMVRTSFTFVRPSPGKDSE
ncbi:hypothetical protein [Nocardia sp. NPDC004860]|uniref:hypothetical protein n=1 Tax=Nocardia sp. NPDC004860 TaxID=3154557 RepID=UPI0033BB0CAA